MGRRRRAAPRPPARRQAVPQRALLVGGIGLIVLAALVVAISRQIAPSSQASGPGGAQAAGGAASLTVIPPAMDLGAISQARGVVAAELAVANSGSAPLVISEMETTCGCTEASLVVDGRAGPWFGMRGHGPWPTGWSATLPPGAQATLRVRYDPDAHGIYRGPVDRIVYIYSSDPRQPRYPVRLTGTQVP